MTPFWVKLELYIVRVEVVLQFTLKDDGDYTKSMIVIYLIIRTLNLKISKECFGLFTLYGQFSEHR